MVSPKSGTTGLRGLRESFYGLRKSPDYAYLDEVDEADLALMAPKSSPSGLRGLRPDFYGGQIEVEVCPDRIYYKGDTLSAIALSVVAAALIKYT